MNIKRIIYGVFTLCLFCFIFSNVQAEEDNSYRLLETVPGGGTEEQVTTFPAYVKGLYNFATGFVVIAALLMITIGGFYYITSAGNQAQAGTAKKIITDALIGLVVVFCAWLILHTINSSLVGADPVNNNLTVDGVANNNSERSVTSTKHSNSKVDSSVDHPQVYCEDTSQNTFNCYNSKEECDSAHTTCEPGQNAFKDGLYYVCDGSDCVTYDDFDSCDNDGHCLSAAEARAKMLNSVESNKDVEESIDNAGGSVDDDAVEDLSKMTKKTQDNAEEMIKQSDGGVIKEVSNAGNEYKTQGASNSEQNGTVDAKEGKTIKGLEKLLVESPADTVDVQQEKTGNKTQYRYEFSADHPNENLRGMVAVYEVEKVKDDKGRWVKRYTDVTHVAAQKIEESEQEE